MSILSANFSFGVFSFTKHEWGADPDSDPDFDTDAPQVRRKDLECGGKRYSARRRFLSGVAIRIETLLPSSCLPVKEEHHLVLWSYENDLCRRWYDAVAINAPRVNIDFVGSQLGLGRKPIDLM